MFKELDTVQLKEAIPDRGLAADALGCVIAALGGGAAYLVEFCNGNGETVAMVELQGEDLKATRLTAKAA